MAIVKTHLYTISFEHDELMKALIKIDELKDTIYPQDSKKIANNVKGVSIMDVTNPYNETLDDTYHLLNRLNIEKEYKEYHQEEIDIVKTRHVLQEINSKIDAIIDVKEEISKELDENKEALVLLQQLEDSNLNIDDIKDCKYLTCRFGKLPIGEKEKIKYYREYPFIFKEISRNQHYIWGLYAGLTTTISEVDNVFYSMSFEEVELPQFIHGTLIDAIQEIQEENQAMDKYIGDMEQRINKVKQEYQEEVLDIFTKVFNLKNLYDQCKYVVDFSHKVAVYAFSSYSLEEIEKQFDTIKNVNILELPANIYDNRGIYSPLLLHNNRFVQPFEGFVSTKNGDTFDATTCSTIIILLSSMLLIGDISVGIITMLVGVLLTLRKPSNVGGVLKMVGLAILLGGLLEGRALYIVQYYPPVFTLPFGLLEGIGIFVAILIGLKIVCSIIKKVTRSKKNA